MGGEEGVGMNLGYGGGKVNIWLRQWNDGGDVGTPGLASGGTIFDYQ